MPFSLNVNVNPARHDTYVTAHDGLLTTQSPGLSEGEHEHHPNTPDSLVVMQEVFALHG